MTVNLQLIDSRIKKLQKLRELLADEETRALIADPELMGLMRTVITSNGNSGKEHIVEIDDFRDESNDYAPADGSFTKKVLDAARSFPGRFETHDIVDKLKMHGHQFGERDPMLAVNQSLRRLTKKKLIKLARKGSGRMPHRYEVKPKEIVA